MRHFYKIFAALIVGITTVSLFQNCGKYETDSSASSFTPKGIACPVYQEPLCGPNEVIATLTNDEGCDYPVCIAKDKPPSCPIYQKPLCQVGEQIVVLIDSNSCPYPKCVPKKQAPSCPIYNRPLCEVGSVLVSTLDDDGCVMPVCQTK